METSRGFTRITRLHTRFNFVYIFLGLNIVALIILLQWRPYSTNCDPSDKDFLNGHNKGDYVNVAHHYGHQINVHYVENFGGAWWKKNLLGWENTTFLYFHTFIRKSTSYVGMGEWIGPTLLFAAKSAKKLVGAEPDPSAYKELKLNVLANPSLSRKITLSKLCISNKAESVTMYGAGGSGSFMSKIEAIGHKEYKDQHPDLHWEAYCIPLWAFINIYEALDEDMFIKLDTEGAEQFIVPSLYPWLSNFTQTTGYRYKPAFFLSLHNTKTWENEAIDHVFEVIRLYKWVSLVGEKIAFQKGEEFQRQTLVDFPWADLYFTDREPEEYGL